MAELKCGVLNCSYNQEECCCKGDIMVGGSHACDCDGTCCESFSQRRGDSYVSSLEHAMQSMWISRAAELVTVGRRPAQRSERPELFKFGLAELLVNRLPVLYFYITINMLDASRLACVLV